MADNRKSDLEQRIEENRQKIEEISAFRDDPKIDKIIRVLQKQIAQDFDQLSLLDEFPNPEMFLGQCMLRSPPITGGGLLVARKQPPIPSFEEM